MSQKKNDEKEFKNIIDTQPLDSLKIEQKQLLVIPEYDSDSELLEGYSIIQKFNSIILK